MDELTLKDLNDLVDIEDLISFILPYYPNLKISENKIEEIEKSLYDVFFRLIGKLINISPMNLRLFLKDYLLKYEIMNIKQIILSVIVGMTNEEKANNVNILIEKYLENTEFINKLIETPSLERIQLLMKPTRYNKAVREGILYFNSSNEIFVLEAFLDQLYYINLLQRERIYSHKEKEMISLFNSLMTELYNINIIYRGIISKIDKKLLSQFLVENYFFLDKSKLDFLTLQENLEEFFLVLDNEFRKIMKLNYNISLKDIEHPIWELNKIYINYYFKQFKIKMDDIEYLTIYRIIELIIKKEKEINMIILPKVVDLLHKKFDMLKSLENK
ncbi:MAG: V-type ATPase subunit [Candidatus Thorarchaeota archaeon]